MIPPNPPYSRGELIHNTENVLWFPPYLRETQGVSSKGKGLIPPNPPYSRNDKK
ncbi:hypothetical protein CWATWH8502_3763 [Crocosphaera watsonii WH 8502]|uniref:Uncharacterized protein n=2 Tax=Crocosphaera watsonii TaxID=263511 RepID=T2IUQ9_CROWT|nr:hypothetical protein CWATWH8502_3763 [Crocosphaera watsonii WH 8502]CCQ56512.1 hypothetical protein CWATWH0005_5790 [Crocosphaera watsonii WH 0005]